MKNHSVFYARTTLIKYTMLSTAVSVSKFVLPSKLVIW